MCPGHGKPDVKPCRVYGAIHVLRNAVGGVGQCGKISLKKRYDDVRFNVISVMRGEWVSNFRKKASRNP